MAYNIFTQIQGPQIDISLFGDAAARGTELGKNIPTGLTSAIRGTQEGIQIGQQIAQNAAQLQGMQQQNTLRQNEIDQIPISNRMQEAQAINAEAIAKQNEIKAAITSVDTDTQLKIQQQELTNNLQQAIQANQDFTNKQKVFNALREVDPNKQADILRDGEVLRSVLGDPKAADQLYGVLSRNPVAKTKYGMQLEQLGGAISFTKLQELENERQKAIIQSQKSIIGDFPTIQKNVSADGQLADIMERHGITDLVSLASRVRTRPTEVSALGGPTTYEVLVDGKPDEVSGVPRRIDDGSNTKLKLLQNGYTAQGIIAAPTPRPVTVASATPAPSKGFFSFSLFGDDEAATPTPTPTATAFTPATPLPGPPPTGAPTPPRDEMTTENSKNNIVSQAGNRLLAQAQSDPDLKQRLIAKGLLKPAPVVTPTPISTPTAVPPPSRAEPIPLKQTVDFTVKNLPAPIRKEVQQPVVMKVLADPNLKGLSSFEKAVVAVESGGNPKAKSKESSATGYFQLINKTAKSLGVDSSNPEDNIRGGVKHLDTLINKYQAEVPALLAYYLGEPVVDSAQNLSGSVQYEDLINGIEYLEAHGFHSKVLTPSTVKHAKNYPLKVLAYKQVFDSIVDV